MARRDKSRIVSHLIEFFFIGFVMGVIEDVIAIKLATDAPITLQTFAMAGMVAFPFAVISEIVVDMKIFRRLIFRK